MYCPECGKKNDEDAVFCTVCGARIEDDTPVPAPSAVMDAKMALGVVFDWLKQHMKAVIPIACAVAAVILFLVVGSIVSNPKRTAERYFKSYMNGDFASAYKELSVSNSPLTSKERYIDCMNKMTREQDFLSYDVRETESPSYSESSFFGSLKQNGKKERDITPEYDIAYTVLNSSSEQHMYIQLVRQKKKSWLFFDSYKVGAEGIIAQNVDIYASEGSTVSVDGYEISAEVAEYGADEVRYHIDAMFAGVYEIAVLNDLFYPIEATEYISGDQSFYYTEAEITDAAIIDATAVASRFVDELLRQCMINGRYEGMPDELVSDDPEANARIKDKAYYMIDSYYGEQRYTSIRMDNFHLSSYSSFANPSNFEVTASCGYSFDAIVRDFSGGTFEVKDQQSDYDANVYLTMEYADGGWRVKSISGCDGFYY